MPTDTLSGHPLAPPAPAETTGAGQTQPREGVLGARLLRRRGARELRGGGTRKALVRPRVRSEGFGDAAGSLWHRANGWLIVAPTARARRSSVIVELLLLEDALDRGAGLNGPVMATEG
jgi:hypothetical protein